MSAIRRRKLNKSSTEKWNPHKYQMYCVVHGVFRKYLALFLDPGLGKTSIILKIYLILKKHKRSKGVLVIAPLRPCYMVWPKEVNKWKDFSRLSVGILHNDWDHPKQITIKQKHDIYVINPEGLAWLVPLLKKLPRKYWPFDMLVVDESTKFKNISSTRFKLLKPLIPAFKFRFILTGTPIPNGLLDLQGQMAIVDNGQTLGTKLGYYRSEYFRQVGRREWNQWEIRDKHTENLIYKKISRFAIRLSALDHLDLPGKIDNPVYVKLPRKARKHYDEIQKEFFTVIEDNEINTPTASAVGIKLWQVANGAIYKDQDILEEKVSSAKREHMVLHDAKLDAMEDLIEELGHKPVLVAYNFKHDLKRLRKRFGKKLVALDDAKTMKQAQKIEKDWNAGKIKILACYPGTSALGLNLQECGSDIIWFSLTYDYEAWSQFMKRIWRQGMKGKVFRNHVIIAEGTIDEAIFETVNKKGKRQTNMLDAVKKYAKKLNK